MEAYLIALLCLIVGIYYPKYIRSRIENRKKL